MKHLFMFKKGRSTDKHSILKNLLITYLILNNIQSSYCYSAAKHAQHVHHNKRSNLKLDFQSNSDNNNPKDDNHYYFPVGYSEISLTCTVTNPSMRYIMKLSKDQSALPKPGKVHSLLKADEFVVNDDELGDPARFNLNDAMDNNNNVYRIMFKIMNLKLSDNGKYICVYHTLVKEIYLHIYDPIEQNDVKLVSVEGDRHETPLDGGTIDLDMDKEYRFKCETNPIYPKANIRFLTNDDAKETQVHEEIVDKGDFYGYKLTTELNFTATYHSNNWNLKCDVTPGAKGVSPVTKSVQLKVKGTVFFDAECNDLVVAAAGQKDVELSCRFYAYPVPKVSWYDLITPNQETKEGEASNEVTENSEQTDESSGEEATNDKKSSAKLIENIEDGGYLVSDLIDEGANTFRSVLKIKEIPADIEGKQLSININIDDKSISRTIKVTSKAPTNPVLSKATDIKLTSMHSCFLTIIIACFINKIFKL